eukprot:SAG31_NODE_3254_length_4489_cov_1.441002_5_plen_47_part_00
MTRRDWALRLKDAKHNAADRKWERLSTVAGKVMDSLPRIHILKFCK